MIRSFRAWFLDQLGMYAAYHTDKRNQLTHYLGVPLIIFSILAALAHVGGASAPLTGASLLLGLLLLAYVIAIPVIGLFCVLAYVPLYVIAVALGDVSAAWRWSLIALCFVGGWMIQFVGHVFEGRRPAFTTNILQLFMAPAFIVAEAAFAAGLQKDLAQALGLRAAKYARP
jgi:uncharacterized membrane protein YGL010W